MGEWLILPDINRIKKAGIEHSIGSRTMQLLVLLAENEGQVVSKETLIDMVWNDVIVTEDSLMKSVSVLRQLLCSQSSEYPKIETVRGIGYRLATPIEYVDQNDILQGFTNRKSKLLTYSILISAFFFAIAGIFITTSFNAKKDPTGLTNVTNDWRPERVPRFSPDGHKVLYAGATEGWNNMDIYIKDLRNNQAEKVVHGEYLETDPIWSPDGKQIAYFRNKGSNIAIFIKDLQLGKEWKVTDINSIINLSAMVWAPDGEWIIFADRSPANGVSSLYKINVHSGIKIRLTHPEGSIIGDLSPRLAPDNSRLAFIRAKKRSMMYGHLIPGGGAIMIRNNADGDVKKFIDVDEDISGLAWIDDQHLAYAVNHDNQTFHIYQINIESKNKALIHQSSNIIRNLDFHWKTNKLIFETWKEHYSIWNYTVREQTTNFSGRLIDGLNSTWQPAIHEPGGKIAFISNQSGSPEIWVRNSEGETARQITDLKFEYVRNIAWSPAGTHLLMEVNIDGNDDIYMVNMATSKSSPFIQTPYEEKYPTWSGDGQHVYYSSNKSGQFEIWKRKVDLHNDIQITKAGGLKAIEYEGSLYFVKSRDWGIWKLTDDGAQRLIEKFSPNDVSNWDITDNKIYYISRSRFWRPELFKYDIQSGQPQHYQSFTMPISHSYAGIAFNSKEHTFLVTHNDRTRSDLKMISLPRSSNVHHQISLITGSLH